MESEGSKMIFIVAEELTVFIMTVTILLQYTMGMYSIQSKKEEHLAVVSVQTNSNSNTLKLQKT